MYMSYCRFEGTRHELRYCLDTVEEHVNGEAEYKVSDNEIGHFENMVKDFVDWLHDMALLDDEGYLDKDALSDICDDMARTRDDDNKNEDF